MKTIAIGAAALAAFALAGCCKECKDEVAVTVNGKALMKSAIDADVEKMLEAQKDRIPADQMENARRMFSEQVAQTFVMKTLLLDQAAAVGMDKVDEAEIAKRKAEFAKANAGRPGAPKSFDEFAEKYPLGKERAEQELRDGAVIQNLLEKEVVSKVKKVDYEAKIRKIHKELSAVPADKLAEKFAEAAKANSDCPSKDKGGDLGEFTHGQMVPEFDKVAFALEPGKLSEPFKTQFGWHIVITTKKIPAVEAKGDTPASPEKVQASHILVDTRSGAKADQDAIRKYFDALREKAQITAPLFPSLLPPVEKAAAAVKEEAKAAAGKAKEAATAVAKEAKAAAQSVKDAVKPAAK